MLICSYAHQPSNKCIFKQTILLLTESKWTGEKGKYLQRFAIYARAENYIISKFILYFNKQCIFFHTILLNKCKLLKRLVEVITDYHIYHFCH